MLSKLVAVLLSACFVPSALHAQTPPPRSISRKPPLTHSAPAVCAGKYSGWLNTDVVYLITEQERREFEASKSERECVQFVDRFWFRRDPDPSTPKNEFREEHYRRLAVANAKFVGSLPGWKTDRGRIYITYGPPDEIDSHPEGARVVRPAEQGGGTTETFPFEKWTYQRIESLGNHRIFDFVDRNGRGDYNLAYSGDGSGFSGR